MKLEVPYYSQFLDVDDLYWVPRACGFCCLKMVLDFYGKDTPSILEMAKTAKENGGYGDSGLKHDYAVSLLKDAGLNSERKEGMVDIKELMESLEKENPVIVSVNKKVLGQNKFHQVVLTGFENENGATKGFYFNDPESLNRDSKFVLLENFLKDWRGMAIFSSK